MFVFPKSRRSKRRFENFTHLYSKVIAESRRLLNERMPLNQIHASPIVTTKDDGRSFGAESKPSTGSDVRKVGFHKGLEIPCALLGL
jgi:hypothetical protein